MEASPEVLKEAVEKTHGVRATFLETVPVSESFQGKPVWEGTVHIFSLEGHPKAKACYAWSSEIEGTNKRRFYAVLHTPPINSAVDAVRASIIEEYRQKNT